MDMDMNMDMDIVPREPEFSCVLPDENL